MFYCNIFTYNNLRFFIPKEPAKPVLATLQHAKDREISRAGCSLEIAASLARLRRKGEEEAGASGRQRFIATSSALQLNEPLNDGKAKAAHRV